MNGIGKEEVGLVSIIVMAGLIGFTINSCNKTSVVDHDIEERQHEFDIKNPKPCKNHSEYVGDGHGACDAGEVPEYQDLGTLTTGHRVWLFCTCQVEQEKPLSLKQPVRSPQKPDEIGKLDDPRLVEAIQAHSSGTGTHEMVVDK